MVWFSIPNDYDGNDSVLSSENFNNSYERAQKSNKPPKTNSLQNLTVCEVSIKSVIDDDAKKLNNHFASYDGSISEIDGSVSILVVDDSPVIRKVIENIMISENYIVSSIMTLNKYAV